MLESVPGTNLIKKIDYFLAKLPLSTFLEVRPNYLQFDLHEIYLFVKISLIKICKQISFKYKNARTALTIKEFFLIL